MRGRRPKSTHLHLVDGSHQVAAAAPVETRKAPACLKGRARKAWDEWIAPVAWLDASRVPAAIAFCVLWREFLEDPGSFDAARHAQMRQYMQDAGLTDTRNRAKSKQGDLFGA